MNDARSRLTSRDGAVLSSLRGSRLFGPLRPADLERVARVAHRTVLGRGTSLWRTGDAATHFTVIVSGLMKIMWRAADGTEYLLGIFGPRESIGDAAVIGGLPYPGAALAVSGRVEVLRIDAKPILEAVATEPWAAQATSRALLHHTRLLTSKIEVMSAGSVPQRLALLLACLAERFGDELEDGRVTVPVKISRTDLACLVGARVETVIRQVGRWQREGLLETTPDGFVLPEPERLDAVARGGDAEALPAAG